MQVYPNSHHAACTIHLWRNVNASFKSKRLAGLVSRAARAFTVAEFNKQFLEIQRINPGCAAYLVDIGEILANMYCVDILFGFKLVEKIVLCTNKNIVLQ